MDTASRSVLSLPRATDAPVTREHRGFRFYYRNARLWGKPIIWSVRYAREATIKFN